MFVFWTGLLAERGLPQAVRWVFHEDFARVPSPRNWRFAFRPRPTTEGDRIARFAYAHLDAKNPLAIVAYAVHAAPSSLDFKVTSSAPMRMCIAMTGTSISTQGKQKI
jgi:hypothetical protein